MSSIKIISSLIILLSLFSLNSGMETLSIHIVGNGSSIHNANGRNEPTKEILITDLSKNLDLKIKAGKKFSVIATGVMAKGSGWFLDNASEIDRKVLEPLNLNELNSTKDFEALKPLLRNSFQKVVYTFNFIAIAKTDKVTLKFVRKIVADNIVEKTVEVSVKII